MCRKGVSSKQKEAAAKKEERSMDGPFSDDHENFIFPRAVWYSQIKMFIRLSGLGRKEVRD